MNNNDDPQPATDVPPIAPEINAETERQAFADLLALLEECPDEGGVRVVVSLDEFSAETIPSTTTDTTENV